MVTRAEIVAEARAWIGTPFHAQGHVKGIGCDCAGLIRGVAMAKSLVDPNEMTAPYSQQPFHYQMSALCAKFMTPIAIKDAQPGDVLEIQFLQEPQHLAILAPYPGGGMSIIHALTLKKKVVEHRLDSRWQKRCKAAYQMPGVA
jgi:NlpC/P60 family putative phage cell wall peptidase